MSAGQSRQALFEGLVFNEEDQVAEVVHVGGEPFYVVMDQDFRRYVDAEVVDRQVLAWLQQQIDSNQELVAEGAMSMLGADDLFTKAMIDASIHDVDKQIEQLMQHGLPENIRAWLGMLGFRIIVNVHGEVVNIDAPAAVDDGDY
jgi:hypothetical protein